MPDKLEKRLAIARQFTQAIPHSRALGMQIEELGPGEALLSMPYDTRFIGDPHTGVLHGGAVAALIDTACGTAVITHPDLPEITATLDLRIDYMRAATPGQELWARATCYHMTRSVAFVRAVAWDEDEARPVATAHGAFTAGGEPAGERAP